MISEGTFGGSKAADILNAILQEYSDKTYIRKVAKYIHMMERAIKNLADLQDDGFYQNTLQMYRHHILDHVHQANLPRIIESHLENHLSVLYKDALYARTGIGKRNVA